MEQNSEYANLDENDEMMKIKFLMKMKGVSFYFYFKNWRIILANPIHAKILNELLANWLQQCKKALYTKMTKWNLYKAGSTFKNELISAILSMEKAMPPHSSTLAWKIPWTEEPGGLQSMGSLRVRHDWVTSLSCFSFRHWRRKWQPTPVFLPGEFQRRGSLMGCHLWGCTKSDMTEVT